MNEIINDNCIDAMREIKGDTIDLTVTSPPYDDMRTFGGYAFEFDPMLIIEGLHRITKPGGLVAWLIQDQTKDSNISGTSFDHVRLFRQAGFKHFHTLIYQRGRRQVGAAADAYFLDFEYLFIFLKGDKPNTYNAIADIPNISGGREKIGGIRKKDGDFKRDKRKVQKYGKRGRVWKYHTGLFHSSKDPVAFKHPAIMSEKLARDIIKTWTIKGDTVLDPMCGSGTTCISAKTLGRNYIGIEVNPEYCKIAKQRMQQTGLEAYGL